jgi:hypothetical protein
VIAALVAFFLMPADNPSYVPQILGIMTNTMLHRIVPVMAIVDFLLFDEHRRFSWHYTLSWLAYLPLYMAFILIRAQLWPHSGPAAGGDPYPYAFIDVGKIGWPQFGINVFELAVGFFVVGLVLFIIDRIEPKRVVHA